MSPEETPPEDLNPSSTDNSFSESEENLTNGDASAAEPTIAEAVMAEPADQADVVVAEDMGFSASHSGFAIAAPPMAGNLENMSANGGAIGSLVLGLWCVAGSFITNWSIINGVIGLLMGFWGLTSRKKKTAWVGIALCVFGIFLSLIQVSELIGEYMTEAEEF
jgi:hypothetical protein